MSLSIRVVLSSGEKVIIIFVIYIFIRMFLLYTHKKCLFILYFLCSFKFQRGFSRMATRIIFCFVRYVSESSKKLGWLFFVFHTCVLKRKVHTTHTHTWHELMCVYIKIFFVFFPNTKKIPKKKRTDGKRKVFH